MKATQVLLLLLAFIAATHARRDLLKDKETLAVLKKEAQQNLAAYANSSTQTGYDVNRFMKPARPHFTSLYYYKKKQ
jgi:hypothetical protein